MKPLHLFIVATTILLLPACDERKTTSEKVGNKIDDLLDRRPGEKVLDASEDAGDAVKRASEDVKDAVKDATN